MSETGRRLAHVATIATLPLLVFLPRPFFLALTGGGALFALLAGPKILAPWARPGESGRRFAFAAASFSIGVFLLLVLFPDRPEAAAGGLALLAIGDGFAGLAGRRFGGPRLPWNRSKSVAGSAAFVALGLPSIVAAVRFAGGAGTPLGAFGIASLATIVAAAAESAPGRLGDNLLVFLAGGLVLGVFDPAHGGAALAVERLPWALAGVGIIAAAGVFAGAIDRRGAAAGLLLGIVVWVGAGPAAFLVVALFVLLGSAASHLRTGRSAGRSARHAFANLAVPAYLALLVGAGGGEAVVVAFVAAVAAALADTLSGEIGMLSGAAPRLIWGGRRVEPGADGGVTFVGTAAGAAGALLVALAAAAGGVTAWGAAPVVGLAGLAGTLADSLLGATAERAGLFGNEEVNFLAAAFAAAAAATWIVLAGS